jgi:polysaccharide export outer membrane protein
MRFVKKLIVLFSVLTLLSASISCSYKQQQVLFESKNPGDTLKTNAFTPPSYKIKPQDLLQIRNLQNRKYIVDEAVTNKTGSTSGGDNGQTYLVEADGTATLPIIGHVKLAGLTRNQAAHQIETLYSKELKDPIIELKIINLKVTLLGEVRSQGVYILVKDQTSLIELIGEAGGLTEKASSKQVKIIRGGTHASEVIELDLSDIQTLSDPRMVLQNDDIVYVAQNKRAIRSDKLQSMSSVLQPIITLLNTALIIYTLTR